MRLSLRLVVVKWFQVDGFWLDTTYAAVMGAVGPAEGVTDESGNTSWLAWLHWYGLRMR